MKNRRITGIQLGIWIITATIGPIIFVSDGNWFCVLLWGMGISFLVWSAMRFGRHWDGVIYNLIQCLWLSVLLAELLPYSAECWPTGERTFPVVPLVLLALASVSALKGCKCTAGGIGVLFWIIVFLLGIIIFAGLPRLSGKYLIPSIGTIKAPMLLTFLLPAAAGFLPREKTGKLPFIIVVALNAGAAIWISGILSPEIADVMPWPFYDAAKSVYLLDVAKRLESLVSVAVTVGNYAMYSLLLCAVKSIGDKFQRGREAVVSATVISAALMLLDAVVDPGILVIVSALLWIFLPLLGILKRKDNE